MKRLRSIIGFTCAVALLLAGCAARGGAAKADAATNRNGTQDHSVRGIITAVSDSEVTIAKAPTVSWTQKGKQGQRPNGQNSGQSPAPSQGQAPAGGQGQASPGKYQTIDTSKWEKVTYKIDAQTKITKRQMDGAKDATQTTASAADLAVDANVLITPRKDDASAADTIEIVGLGGMRPSDSPSSSASPSAPPAASASPSTK